LAPVAVALVLVLGIGSSALAGQWWTTRVRADDTAAVDDKARDVGNNVATLLSRQLDVTDSALTFMRVSPGAGPASLQGWFDAVAAGGRHPGLQVFGYVEVVSTADTARLDGVLSTMGARFAEMSEDVLTKTSSYDPTLDPAASRYCLLTALAGTAAYFHDLDSIQVEYRKFDLCATPVGRYVDMARDTGALVASPFGAPNLISFAAPRFSGDVVPATVEERRASLVAVMSSNVDARTLLRSAAGDDLWLGLERPQPDGTIDLLATSDDRRPGRGATRTVSIDADGTWQLTVAGVPSPAGMAASTQGVAVALVGGLLSALLALLAAVLLRGRDRALRLVDERTGELRHLALHDPLTGLANRTLIADRAQQMLERAQRCGRDSAALFVDLDGFKEVNDTIGHEAGDELLRVVARRFQGVLRAGDTVGRMGGDEFVVLLDGDDDEVGAEAIAERLLGVMREPFRLAENGTPYSVTASVGVAIGRYDDASDLLRDADVAVYRAKANGRDRHVLFLPEMHAAVEDRRSTAAELRAALAQDELFLEYQPTYDIQDQRVQGFEALVRWAHPTRGVVAPLDFIPLAESTGLIVQLGTWVLQQSCTQAAAWHEIGHRLKINVNVSPRQLERADFPATVARVLEETGLDPTALVLEITESALMEDAEAAAGRLQGLKALGVQVAIDDFGTGYSSLAYLRQLPVDLIKIDRSFLTDVGHCPEAAALLHSLIQLGKNLGLGTVAEGIEEPEQAAYLLDQQCDSGQGFLFARPMPAGDAERFLDAAARRGHPVSAPTAG
jgi:diguanylate cyclase (GGDEF)-like protein